MNEMNDRLTEELRALEEDQVWIIGDAPYFAAHVRAGQVEGFPVARTARSSSGFRLTN